MNVETAGPFEDLAEAYDRYRLGYCAEVYEAIFEYGVPANPRALDVACGTGLVAAELVLRGARVTGSDISPAMIERAKTRLGEHGEFVVARAESLPFADASFDLATCAQAFHWFDQPRALREIARVVRPGGTIAVWWKALIRGDGMREIREDIARRIGLDPPPDLLATEFTAFEALPLDDRRLRVVPWRVSVGVESFLGYERSRARSREAYGDKLGEYMELLRERLMADGDRELHLCYTHHVYLGRVPGARG